MCWNADVSYFIKLFALIIADTGSNKQCVQVNDENDENDTMRYLNYEPKPLLSYRSHNNI